MHPDPLPFSEVADDRSALRALIADDPALAELYADGAFVLELGSELVPLVSPIRRERATWYSLAPGDRLPGPAVVEEATSTTFVPPGWALQCLPSGDLLLEALP